MYGKTIPIQNFFFNFSNTQRERKRHRLFEKIDTTCLVKREHVCFLRKKLKTGLLNDEIIVAQVRSQTHWGEINSWMNAQKN